MSPAPHTDEPAPPARTSGLAVASLVCGLLCCIPGSGLIGTVLGAVGLVRIGQSEGRLAGRGMALVGIVLGLLGTLFYIGGTLGVMGVLNGLNVYGDVARGLDKGDHSAVRAMLSPSTAGSLTDEQIGAFAQRVRDEWGAFTGLPKGLPEWITAYGRIGEVANQARKSGPARLAMPLNYERGTAAGVFVLDRDSTGPGGTATASNLAVSARDGSLMWLLDRIPANPGGGGH